VLFPGVLPRFFVYFFYRWESCSRDATVLGMLGVTSLGFLIRDARARFNYDELLAFVLMGVFIVLVGDFASWLVRRFLRR
ncbi:MAG: hypothetical protein P8J87_17350, partial [Verrucomicrobiales bacterium]|nr:hypothetical protein [Verrucomicrobiales bacterium]